MNQEKTPTQLPLVLLADHVRPPHSAQLHGRTVSSEDALKRLKKRGAKSLDPTHISWVCMIKRCHYSKDVSFHNYGGRGIVVCDRWRSSFDNFVTDMGRRPNGSTIDRINNNGPYEPSNCRWATWREQHANRRTCSYITYKGRTLTCTQWARELTMNPATLMRRLKRGWSPEKIIEHPLIGYDRHKRPKSDHP